MEHIQCVPRPLNKSDFFLKFILNQNICCMYSNEPSQLDSSFEHPYHMFEYVDKKIFTILILENGKYIILFTKNGRAHTFAGM